MSLPKKDEKYFMYNDGKIRISRQYKVTIDKVVPYDQIDDNTLRYWKNEQETCPRLYARMTSHFIFATEDSGQEHIFVQTTDGGWFSLGFLIAGRLDHSGELTNRLGS